MLKYLFVIFYFWVVIFYEEGDLTAGAHTSSIGDHVNAQSSMKRGTLLLEPTPQVSEIM